MTPNAQPEAGKKRTSGLMYLNETHKSKMTQQLKLDFFSLRLKHNAHAWLYKTCCFLMNRLTKLNCIACKRVQKQSKVKAQQFVISA